MKERGKIIGDLLDDAILLCALCAVGAVAIDPGANESTDICAKGGVFVGCCDHGFTKQGGEGGTRLAHAGGRVGWPRVRVGGRSCGMRGSNMSRGRDAESWEGGCGCAFDKLWSRLVTLAGRRGTLS